MAAIAALLRDGARELTRMGVVVATFTSNISCVAPDPLECGQGQERRRHHDWPLLAFELRAHRPRNAPGEFVIARVAGIAGDGPVTAIKGEFCLLVGDIVEEHRHEAIDRVAAVAGDDASLTGRQLADVCILVAVRALAMG